MKRHTWGILVRIEVGSIAAVARSQTMPKRMKRLGPFSEYISPQLVPLHLSSGGLARFVAVGLPSASLLPLATRAGNLARTGYLLPLVVPGT